jgi:hypothetical protein
MAPLVPNWSPGVRNCHGKNDTGDAPWEETSSVKRVDKGHAYRIHRGNIPLGSRYDALGSRPSLCCSLGSQRIVFNGHPGLQPMFRFYSVTIPLMLSCRVTITTSADIGIISKAARRPALAITGGIKNGILRNTKIWSLTTEPRIYHSLLILDGHPSLLLSDNTVRSLQTNSIYKRLSEPNHTLFAWPPPFLIVYNRHYFDFSLRGLCIHVFHPFFRFAGFSDANARTVTSLGRFCVLSR